MPRWPNTNRRPVATGRGGVQAAGTTPAPPLVSLLARAGRGRATCCRTCTSTRSTSPAAPARCSSSTTRATARCRPPRASASKRCGPIPGMPEPTRRRSSPARSTGGHRCSSPTSTRRCRTLRRAWARRAALLLPLARGDERVGLLAVGFADGAGRRVRSGAAARSATRFSPRSSCSACARATSCSATSARCSTNSRAACRPRSTWRPASTSSATARTGCSAPTARRSGFTIAARATSCCRPRPITEHADARRARRAPTTARRRAAVAMRRTRVGDRPGLGRRRRPRRSTVPLRGTRRALGTIVFEGVRVEAGRRARPARSRRRAGTPARRAPSRTCSCSTT